jgi:hypothetical protein
VPLAAGPNTIRQSSARPSLLRLSEASTAMPEAAAETTPRVKTRTMRPPPFGVPST